VLLYQHEHHLPLGKRIKPLLRAACFMTTPHLDVLQCRHRASRLAGRRKDGGLWRRIFAAPWERLTAT
jgi:hypothetical protein